MNKHIILMCTITPILLGASNINASAISLFHEDFDGITQGYSGSDPQQYGIPKSGGGNTLNGGADSDWYGARFEYPDGGTIAQDVGVQKFGGSPNSTPVGLIEDDAGLMFKIDTTGLENITLEFDWRTFATSSNDRFVVGYFVGDLDGVTNSLGNTVPGGFAGDDTIDLRNQEHFDDVTGATGPHDGPWNWDPINGGNTGDWIELLRARDESWSFDVTFDLALADNAPEVWIAFWLDNGENDHGKFDNIDVTGDLISAIPVPAAVWLFGSGLLCLVGAARRKTS